MLRAAGCDTAVLSLIPSICDTCPQCREWHRPAPEAQVNPSMSEVFNETVEMDLLFYKQYVVLHLVCRCTRWHAARCIPSRSEDDIISALDDCWVSIHGPMKYLVCDMETALWQGMSTKQWFSRRGIQYKPRARYQHARFIERRGELLRQHLHKIDSQLESEGIINVPFKDRLSEAVFAGNALLTVNHTTPYNAVYGRVPALLPSPGSYHDAHIAGRDGLRMPSNPVSSQRLREISIQKMIEGTAQARINQASRAKTQPPVQAEQWRVGDLVDFHTKQTNKDVSGWVGPATIVNTLNTLDGYLDIKWQGRVYTRRFQDIRRHLVFWTSLQAFPTVHDYSYTTAERIVTQALAHLPRNTSKLFGEVYHDGKWSLS